MVKFSDWATPTMKFNVKQSNSLIFSYFAEFWTWNFWGIRRLLRFRYPHDDILRKTVDLKGSQASKCLIYTAKDKINGCLMIHQFFLEINSRKCISKPNFVSWLWIFWNIFLWPIWRCLGRHLRPGFPLFNGPKTQFSNCFRQTLVESIFALISQFATH